MRGLPPELIYILVFAVVVVVQFLMKLRRKPPPEATPQPELPFPPYDMPSELPPGAPSEKQVIPMDWSAPVRAFVEQLGRSEAPPAERPARAPRRFSRRALMGTKRDVQNAVVIATILGPCRALEPADAGAAPVRPTTRRPAPSRTGG